MVRKNHVIFEHIEANFSRLFKIKEVEITLSRSECFFQFKNVLIKKRESFNLFMICAYFACRLMRKEEDILCERL